ncbi:MAG: hypothetical protein JJE04_24965 [Acidobacteriia bacterium]|nr:hypothetical protein [Terriglobia bacterium]
MKYLSILVLAAASATAADVAGKWDVVAQTASGREYKLALELTDQDGKWSGKMSGPQGDIPLEEVQFNGKELTYSFTLSQGQFKIKLGLEEGALKGSFTTPDETSGTLSATRPITGLWNIAAKLSDGSEHRLKLSLKQEEGLLKGQFILPKGQTIPVTDLKLAGSELTFKTSSGNAAYDIKLTLAGASMKGTFTAGNGASGSVEATR